MDGSSRSRPRIEGLPPVPAADGKRDSGNSSALISAGKNSFGVKGQLPPGAALSQSSSTKRISVLSKALVFVGLKQAPPKVSDMTPTQLTSEGLSASISDTLIARAEEEGYAINEYNVSRMVEDTVTKFERQERNNPSAPEIEEAVGNMLKNTLVMAKYHL
ncbi:MAG TPA: hypothetical protein VLJ86_11895 [Ramlibacter sp.]|nr:hypothetical protein [Ramlibacter sp.]